MFKDERSGESETFHYERGIVQFVEHLNRASEPAHPDILYYSKASSKGSASRSRCSTAGEYTENLQSYVNNISTTEGGTHLSGFRAALTPLAEQLWQKREPVQGPRPHGRRFPRRAHLLVISRARAGAAVRRADQDQARQRRGRRPRQLDRRRVPRTSILEENPKHGQSDRVEGGSSPPRPARAARKARELVRERKERPLGGGGLARQARATARARKSTSASCTSWRVTPPAARRRRRPRSASIQAILPLRGKIINAYKSREDKVLANEEVRSIISAIGTRHRRRAESRQASVRQASSS